MKQKIISAVKYGLKGGIMAAILNILIFEIAVYVFGLEFNVLMNGAINPVALIHVVMASLIPAIVATALYIVLLKTTQNPNKIFRVIAVAILFLSFYTPFAFASVLADKLMLSLMHIVAAFEITKSLTHDLNQANRV